MATEKLTEFLSADDIRAAVERLGKEINRDMQGTTPIVVGVLKGSFMFLADLVRAIELPLEISFVGVSSYEGTRTSGAVRLTADIDRPLKGRNVVIVEDIIDTGITMSYLLKLLEIREPASIKVVSLLDKPSRRLADFNPDYIGFPIPDEFVVGYGLDYDEKYRELKNICTVSFE